MPEISRRRTNGRNGGKAAPAPRTRPPEDVPWATEVLENLPSLVCLARDGLIHYLNRAGTQMLGLGSPVHAIGRPLLDIVARDDRPAAAAKLRSAGKAGAPVRIKLLKRGKTPVETEAVFSKLRDGAIMVEASEGRRSSRQKDLESAYAKLEAELERRSRSYKIETSERRRVEEKLRLAGRVIDNLGEAIAVLDPDFRVTSVNRAFIEVTGYGVEHLQSKRPPFYKVLTKDVALYAEMVKATEEKGIWEGEYWTKTRDGKDYAEHLAISAVVDDSSRVQQYAAVVTDITRRKQDEERIIQQANFDTLTGLPNRALFLDRLSQALANMSRAGSKLGLMFIDLDGFKLVNDTLGHDVGDMLLKEAAVRLGQCIRSGDTVARLGGDEFTVIMPNLVDPRHAPLVAQRVLDALAKPFILTGHEAFVSGSIGITIFPDDAKDASELLRNADSAMYRAKEQGKANYQFFTSDLNQEVKERLILKNGLVKALENAEFQLHFQPKLDLITGRIDTAEALLRWDNKVLGNVSPGRFIPVLEETGMVVEVGEWAIRTACEQHLAWRKAGLPPIRIAVNLSARQLREAAFVSVVERVLTDTGVEPAHLEIEITESMLMSDTQKTVVALRALHEKGIHVAMDDFGTGYSSLSYLKRFPIDTIKIDRSFVADIATSADDAEIIRTIITMGHTLNRRIVAEGVETSEQVDILRQYRCNEIQGFFVSPPLTGEKLKAFLAQKHDMAGLEAAPQTSAQ